MDLLFCEHSPVHVCCLPAQFFIINKNWTLLKAQEELMWVEAIESCHSMFPQYQSILAVFRRRQSCINSESIQQNEKSNYLSVKTFTEN